MGSYLYPLRNPVMNYAWGSHQALALLRGEPSPSDQPEAELWLGAHPKAPSQVFVDESWQNLDRFLADDPQNRLGPSVSQRFANQLPFLLKVLAAAEPLSIQAHPSLSEARAGFANEDAQGLDRDAATRNFRDANHKPELLCALSPFWALAGLRPLQQSQQLAQDLGFLGLLRQIDAALSHNDDDADHTQRNDIDAQDASRKQTAALILWRNLLTLARAQRRELLSELRHCLDATPGHVDPDLHHWLLLLSQRYPDDVGVCAPLLLNLIHLQPGQAIALRAGVLHAYLQGTGVEIMANSDNVLRGGLTPKHIDVETLLKVLQADGKAPEIFSGQTAISGADAGVALYQPGFAEFSLARWDLEQGSVALPAGLQILLCTAGKVQIDDDNGQTKQLRQGQSLFASASFAGGRITGTGQVFRAFVPGHSSR